VQSKSRDERDAFRGRLKEEWGLLWKERFDDRLRAESVSVRDYPLLFMSRGHVISASRDTRTPSFSQIVQVWASQGLVYSPHPDVGGWGRFVRTEMNKATGSRARAFANDERKPQKERKHLKKGGRGWLHK
jgi:hypothetical protein